MSLHAGQEQWQWWQQWQREGQMRWRRKEWQEWQNESDNYSSVYYKEVHYKADAKKKKEKELHMHEKEDKEEISMAELAFTMAELVFTDSKEEYFNSEHSPMVQRVHPETIIAIPIVPRSKKMKT
eukprot:5699371-Ditylum_brightwellii.AAC.1